MPDNFPISTLSDPDERAPYYASQLGIDRLQRRPQRLSEYDHRQLGSVDSLCTAKGAPTEVFEGGRERRLHGRTVVAEI